MPPSTRPPSGTRGPRPAGGGRPGSGQRGFGRPPGGGDRASGPGAPGGPPRGRKPGKPKPVRLLPGVPARAAALDILRAVRKGESLEEACDGARGFAVLEGPDRGFARLLATTVLRRMGTLDAIYEPDLDRELKPEQEELRAMLQLCAAQLILLDTPIHAVASTMVEVAKTRRDTEGYAGLVNVLCRRIADKGATRMAGQPARIDTPGWLWRRLERAYGPDMARAIAEAHRGEPPLDLTMCDPAEAEAWAGHLEATPIGPRTLRRAVGGRIEALPGYNEGAWWVQDLAATLPVALFGDVAGKTVYDLCAAPGGKTMQLAASGAHVTAVDASKARLERLADNLRRTRLDAHILHEDVLAWQPNERADLVLLDAPCTATGTIRRNPDLLWSKGEENLNALQNLQDHMLDEASRMVKPGGLLVFSTCSLLPEEGEARIAAALARHPGLSRLPIDPARIGGLPVINKDGDIRALPSIMTSAGGMDGFFASVLQKA